MSTTSKALNPGTILNGNKTYCIERVLGAGGFGITYLASFSLKVENLEVRAQVAIKEHYLRAHCDRGGDGTTVICPGTEDSRAMTADSLKDFVAEAARLKEYGANHHNIVKVNEIIETNGTAYYVMEFLQGQSLNDYIYEHGPLSENEIRELVYPIIDAAAYLHRQKVTHLDIKPGNIMLAKNVDGSLRPVLIDFGLSKHYNADGSATSTVNTMACSDGYAPMEQYMGIRTFSPAADVYALGATLYHAATGKVPARAGEWGPGESAATVNALPVSEQLKRVILKSLAPMAGERYADAGGMLEELGVKSAASAATHTVRIQKQKSKNDTVRVTATPPPFVPAAHEPVISPKTGGSVKSSKSFSSTGFIAAIVIALVLGIGGCLMFFNSDTEEKPEEDAQELIAEAEEAEVLPAEDVQQTPAQQTESDEATRLAAEREELDRQRQELERLNTERAETERQQQEAAEQERIRQETEARERQRQEAERAEAERRQREEAQRYTTPHNLDLAVRRGNQTLYFNQSNWQNLYQSGDQKLGVVIIRNGQRFILALEDLNGGTAMNWYDAMSRSGSRLPSKDQAEAMRQQCNEINSALNAFGGICMNSWYWTKTEYDPNSAWIVGLNYSIINNLIGKANTGKSRAVYPIP